MYNSEAWEWSKRKNTTFTTRQKFEIKKNSRTLTDRNYLKKNHQTYRQVLILVINQLNAQILILK